MASLQQRLLKLELNLKEENESSLTSRSGRRSSDNGRGNNGSLFQAPSRVVGNSSMNNPFAAPAIASGRASSAGGHHHHSHSVQAYTNNLFNNNNNGGSSSSNPATTTTSTPPPSSMTSSSSASTLTNTINNNNNNHFYQSPFHSFFARSFSGGRKLSKDSLLNGNQVSQREPIQTGLQSGPHQPTGHQSIDFIASNPSVNAQCLSPRPRPKALPIGSSVRPHSPSPKSLAFNNGLTANNNKEKVRLSDKFKQSCLLVIDGKGYQCHENDLQHMGELGSGSCGHVVKMKHLPSGKMIAVKQMRRSEDPDETKRIAMDLEVLLKCHSCEYIVKCCGYVIKDTEVWICMELMATCFDKLLKKLQKPVPEPILGKVALATVKALNYLKEVHGVIHRDVKPSNILLNEKGEIKLCDFGISGRLVDSKAKTRGAACPAYIAPERIDPPDPTKPSYDIRADVWSLGISLVEMAMGKFPYSECKTDFEVLSKILQADAPALPNNGTFSNEICSFIKACLTKDYNIRPKYKQLLEHPFIKIYEKKHVDVAAWYRDILHPDTNKG